MMLIGKTANSYYVISSGILQGLVYTATFTLHETKLTSTDLKPSLRQLLQRLWRRL